MPTELLNSPHRFEPKSHLLVQPGLISQVANQAFGPVSADKFRLTSKFSLATDTMAYAICSGIVFIQPQTGSTDKVNLILRPFVQPIQGVSVKYFIYRGLKKIDFFDSANKVIPTVSASSDFIKKINASFLAFNSGDTPFPDFLGSYIGYDLAVTNDTKLLDTYFFKVATFTSPTPNTDPVEDNAFAFELPKINLGESLGRFASGECGIDVVLNHGDYTINNDPSQFVFDLKYARAKEATIELTGITDLVEKKWIKEQIFQFIDIAAYYGSHHCEKGVVSVTTTSGTIIPKTFDEIYNLVLDGFITKNNYYLYIQSDRTRSYDFYENYKIGATGTNNLLYGTLATALTPKEYATSGWPLIIENADQTHTNDRNSIYLQLVTDNNVNAVLYGQTACVDSGLRNHFMSAEQLQQPLDANGLVSNLTNTIILSNPAFVSGATKKHIANFGILIYQGKSYTYLAGQETDDTGALVDVFQQPNFFDDVFDLIGTSTVFSNAQNGGYSVSTSVRLKPIIEFTNEKVNAITTNQTLKITDTIETDDTLNPISERVIYLTQPMDALGNATAVLKKPNQTTTSIASSSSGMKQKRFTIPYPFQFEIKAFTESYQEIIGLLLKTDDYSVPNCIVLGVSKQENDVIAQLIVQNQLQNGRVFLIDLFQGGTTLISTDNIQYKKYKLAVVGENNSGELQLYLPATAIFIYSLDGLYHFSNEFSKSEKVGSKEIVTMEFGINLI